MERSVCILTYKNYEYYELRILLYNTVHTGTGRSSNIRKLENLKTFTLFHTPVKVEIAMRQRRILAQGNLAVIVDHPL